MIKFSEYPAFKLLTGIASGFLIGVQFSISEFYLLIVLACVFLFSCALFYLKKYLLIYIVCALAAGIWLSVQVGFLSIQSPDKIIQDMPAVIEGKVVKIIKSNKRYLRCIVEGWVDSKALPKIDNTRIILSIFKLDERDMKIMPGSGIAANATVRLPRKAILPTDFPEKQYCASLDVQWLARAGAKNIAILQAPSGFYYIRGQIVEYIQNTAERLFSPEVAGIAIALLTGDKSKIDIEQKRAFSYAGTGHVLAVSGLHVGIISAAVYFLLGFVRNRWLKFILFTLIVSGFVVLTGMQPSAMRAGLMAVAFLLARTLQRRAKLLNIISLAIILIVIFFPSQIVSAAFHMSVASIFGIILMYKPINQFLKKNFRPKNKIAVYVINSISVSLAISIVVCPIVAYYFDTFSLISPLTNLFVIPLMFLGMVYTCLSIGLSFLSIGIAQIYASAAELLFLTVQNINFYAIEIPFAYIHGGRVYTRLL